MAKNLEEWKVWARGELDKALTAFNIPPESIALEFVPSLAQYPGENQRTAARADVLRNKIEFALDGFHQSTDSDEKNEEETTPFCTDMEPRDKFILYHEVGHLKDRVAQKLFGLSAGYLLASTSFSWLLCSKLFPRLIDRFLSSDYADLAKQYLPYVGPLICFLGFGQLFLYILDRHSEYREFVADQLAADKLIELGEERCVAVTLCMQSLLGTDGKAVGGHAAPHVEVEVLSRHLRKKGHKVEIERQVNDKEIICRACVNSSTVTVTWQHPD